mmetsp:Transcript_69900/g.166839  ORF Transcript_69900/g.166839 Transcript_69900/m.166839 type:complete len:202 (-) Transcript_69900:1010-1615(-)
MDMCTAFYNRQTRLSWETAAVKKEGHQGPTQAHFTTLTQKSLYGGKRSTSRRRDLDITARLWESSSNPCFPWYAPKPLGPEPPKGRAGFARCMAVSLMHTPPLLVLSMTYFARELLGENTYRASGVSRSLMNSMAESRSSTGTTDIMGPKASSTIAGDDKSGLAMMVGGTKHFAASAPASAADPPQITCPPEVSIIFLMRS